MTDLTLWLTLAAMTLVAFALRYVPMAMLERFKPSAGLQQALRYVPAATLAGLVFPALLAPEGRWAIEPGNARLLAGLLAVWAAWRYKNVLLTLGLGMGALWMLQALGW